MKYLPLLLSIVYGDSFLFLNDENIFKIHKHYIYIYIYTLHAVHIHSMMAISRGQNVLFQNF
jgi:hypothetical protein